MKAYGIFAGGGVKGAALAGALEAAQREKINFLGYGGASAGAIIAYLSAIGYSGREIYIKMIRSPFKDMLFEDKGEKLFLLKKSVSSLSSFPVSLKNIFKGTNRQNFVNKAKDIVVTCPPFIYSIVPITNIVRSKELGIYNTDHLRNTLVEWTRKEAPNLLIGYDNRLTFAQLHKETDLDLKIICSDLSSKRAVVYSVQTTPDEDVLDAVCSSASYPFLFNPQICDEKVLIDGGLSSNVPMFMFKDEQKNANIPIYAFDLYKEAILPEGKLGRLSYVSRLIDTALEASDNVMFEMLNAKRVKVNVPQDIDTLDVNVSKLDVMRLYYAGLTDGLEFFSNDQTVKLLKASLDDITKEALANYGSAEMFEVVLNAIQEESTFEEELVRVWLYVPTSRNSLVSISVSANASGKLYEWPLDSSDDVIDAREAWTKKAEVVSSDNAETKTRVSFPIFREEDTLRFHQSNTTESHCIGVLVLDTNVAPEECMWLYLNKSRVVLEETFRTKMLQPWLVLLSRVLSNARF
ncbi:hypothetical protein BBM86_11745 [Vibrio parahaemolyticus]|uniref:patatin-like phospholipase family protein n=1 Tax=Vibrio parahaemolyticus TaxID=670 RepID=UPI00084AFA73|nr:patatin-like phospholipase family protein [Vibrio parahaemolyticus]EJS4057352.1 patatin-like phospholipase family protein [Vibrio parahaemolyticus]OEB81710.1 hypothetical protein BBM86_11745 [Vibrio parahaemolyticus]